jgi:hypothetical protein
VHDRSVVRILLVVLAAAGMSASQSPSVVAERVTALTRETPWRAVAALPIAFDTFHPQGMVKIGDTFIVSSVEVVDRAAGIGAGHLFKIDAAGNRLADLRLGAGSIYHPGGIDYDGTSVWVPVAEYRPDSRSIVYRVDPVTMKAAEVFRFDDHIGAIVHDVDDGTLHGVSWGSRRFYRWKIGRDGRVASTAPQPRANTSHYLDYQDCKYAGAHRMVCTGVTEIRQSAAAALFRLGGIELVDLADGRPLHQVPVLLWTSGGLDMTHNPVWLEPRGASLRAYFMPEDTRSTIYVYDAGIK